MIEMKNRGDMEMWYEDLKNRKQVEVCNERKVNGISIGRRRRNLVQYRLGKLELRHYLKAGVFVLNRRGSYEKVDKKMLRNWIRTGRVVADGDIRDVMADLVMCGERIIL